VFLPGACRPSKINFSDRGTNRGCDNLFQDKGTNFSFQFASCKSGGNVCIFLGLRTIFKELNIPIEGKKIGAVRDMLWDRSEVKAQRIRQEIVADKKNCLFLLNVVAHPCFSAIEYLWRDVRHDYRQNWSKTEGNVFECWKAWLKNGSSDDITPEWVESCYRAADAYVQHYLHGATDYPSQYQVRKAAESHFETYENGRSAKDDAMKRLHWSLPELREAERQGKDALYPLLEEYIHKLNWMWIRKPKLPQ